MKQIEKRLAALLALLLAAAMLAGCGGKDGGFSPIRAENAANLPAGDSEEWILTNKSANSVALGTPEGVEAFCRGIQKAAPVILSFRFFQYIIICMERLCEDEMR